MITAHHTDPHAQLRTLYVSLLTRQERFDEFKQLLSMYPAEAGEGETEPAAAAEVRRKLNERIRDWTGTPFAGLSSSQIQMWRAIVVDERINVALSPWKESNGY
ncbi:MAG: hypothetical protein JXP73_21565 [Deltaproteobacteria bacterium]|nr:hypothetical protein [Deltaproteobacteria bacterium]